MASNNFTSYGTQWNRVSFLIINTKPLRITLKGLIFGWLTRKISSSEESWTSRGNSISFLIFLRARDIFNRSLNVRVARLCATVERDKSKASLWLETVSSKYRPRWKTSYNVPSENWCTRSIVQDPGRNRNPVRRCTNVQRLNYLRLRQI